MSPGGSAEARESVIRERFTRERAMALFEGPDRNRNIMIAVAAVVLIVIIYLYATDRFAGII